MSPNSCFGKLPPSGRAALTLAETITQSRPQFLTGYIKLPPLSSVWPQHRTPYADESLLQFDPPVLLYDTKIIVSLICWHRYTSKAFKPQGDNHRPQWCLGWSWLWRFGHGDKTLQWLALHTVHYKPDYINHVPSGKVDKTFMELHRIIKRLF